MNAAESEEAAGLERARAVGMFRYGLIRDAADPGLSSRQRGRMVRALAEKDHLHPSGQRVRYSRDHLDRWIRRWRRGGFDWLDEDRREALTRADRPKIGGRPKKGQWGTVSLWRSTSGMELLVAEAYVRWGAELA